MRNLKKLSLSQVNLRIKAIVWLGWLFFCCFAVYVLVDRFVKF
jgi:hypothetical protein